MGAAETVIAGALERRSTRCEAHGRMAAGQYEGRFGACRAALE